MGRCRGSAPGRSRTRALGSEDLMHDFSDCPLAAAKCHGEHERRPGNSSFIPIRPIDVAVIHRCGCQRGCQPPALAHAQPALWDLVTAGFLAASGLWQRAGFVTGNLSSGRTAAGGPASAAYPMASGRQGGRECCCSRDGPGIRTSTRGRWSRTRGIPPQNRARTLFGPGLGPPGGF